MVDFAHKIHPPQRSAHVVSRPRLNELLQMIVDRRLICIYGPSGYGKTSLLIDFADRAPLPICWYTLDSLDQDPWVFLEYLAASVEYRFAGATQATQQMLAGHSHTAFMSAVSAITRDIYQIGRDFAIILDDWDLIDGIPEIRDLIGTLLTRCPNCKVILSSRMYPSLPGLMLLAARRQMLGLDEHQLRFTPEEVSAVLSVEQARSIDCAQVQALVEQTHGWITGILLLLQTHMLTPQPPLAADVCGERQVYRFFAEQVFDQQPPQVQRFLLDSALLDEVTAWSCDSLFGQQNSHQLLETLLRRQIFISEIKEGVFRYHPLFREFLREHYQVVAPQRYRESMLLIADRHLEDHQWLQAFDLYIAIRCFDQAQEVVGISGEHLYAIGRLETLASWFQALPAERLPVPLLCLKARVAMDKGALAEARALAETAQRRMRPAEEPVVLLLRAQIARVMGNYPEIPALGQRILDLTDDPGLRGAALRIIGVCYQRQGQISQAISTLQEALLIEQRRGDIHAISKIQHELGIAYKTIGLFQIADRYYTSVEQHASKVGNPGLRALSRNSKGIMEFMLGRYHEAHSLLTMALEDARASAVPPYQAAVLSSLGDFYASLQLWDRALGFYNEASAAGGTATIISDIDLALIRMQITQQRYYEAANALHSLSEVTARSRSHQIVLLQGIVACGLGRYERAADIARAALKALEPQGASMDLALAYLLQAEIAARAQPSDTQKLLDALECAAQVANQIGHDTFLVTALFRIQDILPLALAFGWARADVWRKRQQEIVQVARELDQGNPSNCLAIRSLGAEQIVFNRQLVTIGWSKAREVFFYLLAHPDGASIDELCENIWPNLSAQRSREALRTAIYQVRSEFPRDFIVLHGRQIYRLDRDLVRIEYDVEQFLTITYLQTERIEALLSALDLYRGSYLPSSDNQWSVTLRTYLEQRYLYVLHKVAAHYEKEHNYLEALVFYQRRLELDSLDELAHAGVMRCQIALGNRAAAVQQYHVVRHLLDDELGLNPPPTSELELIYRQILSDT